MKRSKLTYSKLQTAVSVMLGLLLFSGAVTFCHRMLQNENCYRIASKIVKTYDTGVTDDGIKYVNPVERPFMRPDDSLLLSWDAEHYDEIRRWMYNPEHSWSGNFAFFPLFPLLWRMTGFPPKGICALNWLIFCLGAALLMIPLQKRLEPWMLLLVGCIPMMVVFMIPYSESLFFLCVAAGILGHFKKSYWLYFIGFMGAAMTRSAGSILVVAWIITDIIAFLSSGRSWKELLRNMAMHIAPIIAGVLAVMLFQHFRGAEHWFEFALAQKGWGKSLSLPSWPLTDWSAEGKSITNTLLYLLFLPSRIWMASLLLRSLGKKNPPVFDEWLQMRCMSVLYFIGNILLALLTQHGCMNSLARYLTCTPFFIFLVLDMAREKQPKKWLYIIGICAVPALVFCRYVLVRIPWMGGAILFLTAAIVFCHHFMNKKIRNALLVLTLLLTIFWTAYLFNCFMNDSWIFT